VQETLAHVKKSYEANSDLSACTSVPSHGWVVRERRQRRERETHKGTAQHTVVEDKGDGLDDKAISRIMTEVQEAHPGVKFEAQDANRSISVRERQT
jgi:hypothetical protein